MDNPSYTKKELNEIDRNNKMKKKHRHGNNHHYFVKYKHYLNSHKKLRCHNKSNFNNFDPDKEVPVQQYYMLPYRTIKGRWRAIVGGRVCHCCGPVSCTIKKYYVI